MTVLEGIKVLYHSSIKIEKGVKIYVDPYKIEEDFHDADFVFITHEHYDHFSPEDIKKIVKDDTYIISVQDVINNCKELQPNDLNRISVKPNETYELSNIKFETVVAYNEEKQFHPKNKEWVGYIITIDGARIYVAGDTDAVEELKTIKCDVALVPIGGTYTMNFEEAAKLVNEIQPRYAIPMHYGAIVGTKQDAINFKELINNEIEVKLFI